jgi:hypothetical protein
MLQPPPVVCPDVPTTPLVTVDKPSDAPHLRVVEPIIAVAPNIAFIAPIVILIAIGSKMNIAASGIARSNFIVKGKSFPCVHLLQRDLVIPTSVNFRHDAFNAMAEVLEHFSNSPFVVEAHYDEVSFETFVDKRFRVAPISRRSDHVGFPIAKVGSAKQPNLVYFAAVYPSNQVELSDEPAVINAIRLMPTLPFTPTS